MQQKSRPNEGLIGPDEELPKGVLDKENAQTAKKPKASLVTIGSEIKQLHSLMKGMQMQLK